MAITMYDLCGAVSELRFSPYCWRVRMALRHKGLDAQTVPWRFTEQDALARAGGKTVPVLVDGERSVCDSWEIARHLEAAYPDRPSLFGGAAGEAAALFVKSWSEAVLHRPILKLVILDIHAALDDTDKAYFRSSREARFGQRLESFADDSPAAYDALRGALAPLRAMLERQPYIGGGGPLFSDYIVFGALQWPRIVSRKKLLEAGDPVQAWFDRLLDAFGGMARTAPRAAA